MDGKSLKRRGREGQRSIGRVEAESAGQEAGNILISVQKHDKTISDFVASVGPSTRSSVQFSYRARC